MKKIGKNSITSSAKFGAKKNAVINPEILSPQNARHYESFSPIVFGISTKYSWIFAGRASTEMPSKYAISCRIKLSRYLARRVYPSFSPAICMHE